MKEGDRIKQNPFRVPENYFDEVNRKILSSVTDRYGARKLTIIPKLKPYLAIAASVAVLITAGYLTIRLLEKKTIYPEVSHIINSSPEVLLNEIDPFTLENSAAVTADFEEDPDLSSDEIIDYLANEDFDISIIYEKL